MSGRGTIKAGTYGGRRFREKQKQSQQQNKQLAKDIKKAQSSVPKSMKIREDLPMPARLPRRGNVLNAPLGRGGTGLAPTMYQDFDAPEIPFVGKKPFAPYGRSRDDRSRDIQAVVNTMPLRQDARYNALIRQEVEQRHREELNPDIDFEDYTEQEDIEDFSAQAEAGTIVDEETGEMEYGTAVPDFSGFNEVDDLAFDPFTDDPIEDDVIETDSDEEAEAFGRALDKAGEKKNLAEEIARRKAERQRKSMSAPPGERMRPPNGFFDAKVDFQAEDDSGAGRRTKLSDPTKELKYIRGLAPQEKMPTKYYSERLQRDKKGNLKTKKVKTITHSDAKEDYDITINPIDEDTRRLYEGRTLDLRHPDGRNIAKAERSRMKKQDLLAQAGYQEKTDKRVYDLGEGVKRDPRTRKVLTDKKGNPKMEKKSLTIAPRTKQVEELWGLEQKGMSREDDNLAYRDPYSGRRAIAKEPGKRATKSKEAITKHALYVKSQREKDPDYVPRGFNQFNYGAGIGPFDKKRPKVPETQPQGLNDVSQGVNDVSQLSIGDVGDDELDALKEYAPAPPSGFTPSPAMIRESSQYAESIRPEREAFFNAPSTANNPLGDVYMAMPKDYEGNIIQAPHKDHDKARGIRRDRKGNEYKINQFRNITNPPMRNSQATAGASQPMNTTAGSMPPGINNPTTLSPEDYARANLSIRQANTTFVPEPMYDFAPFDFDDTDSMFDGPDSPTYNPGSP